MKKTYHLLHKFIFIILAELIFVALLGVVSFAYLYNLSTDSLPYPHVITILFAIMVAATIATSVYVCINSHEIGVTRIKKTNKFILFADAFAVVMMLIFFIYECVTSMTYINKEQNAIVFFRVSRWIISIPALGYFIIQALPKKIRRTRVVIPDYLKLIASVCLILWCILGVFTTYFASHLTNPKDITKITMMFIYVIIAMFFILEGEFELIKARHKPYMIAAFTTATVTFAIPLGISIAKVFKPSMAWEALSQPELLVCAAIGIYALAKMFALVSTMALVIENSHGSTPSASKQRKSASQSSDTAPKAEDGSADKGDKAYLIKPDKK